MGLPRRENAKNGTFSKEPIAYTLALETVSLYLTSGIPMFSKNKIKSKIDLEQHDMLETAHIRIKQKKRLYAHFVIFLIGSVFLIFINKILKYEYDYNWFIWAITLWAFFFIIHFVHVFIIDKFLGKEWERSQREKLVQLQKERIKALQKEIETEFPLSQINKKKDP